MRVCIYIYIHIYIYIYIYIYMPRLACQTSATPLRTVCRILRRPILQRAPDK